MPSQNQRSQKLIRGWAVLAGVAWKSLAAVAGAVLIQRWAGITESVAQRKVAVWASVDGERVDCERPWIDLCWSQMQAAA